MSIHNISDQANAIICDQEEAIQALRDKVMEVEDQRDGFKDQVLELKKAIRRIECADDIKVAHTIAGLALVEMPIVCEKNI